MKKVLLIASELGKGGAERSISFLSYFLAAHYDVTLCILSGKDRTRYYKTCANVIFIDPPKAAGFISKLKAWRYRIKQVRHLKQSLGIDASISFLEGTNYVNIVTKGSEKTILGVRGSKQFDLEIAGWQGRFRKHFLIPFFYAKADVVVCASKALVHELNHFFKVPADKLVAIYNLYDKEEIRLKAAMPLTANEQLIFSKPVLINSGRLHPQKKQAELIRLFGLFKKQMNVRLVILGDGTLKQHLMNEAESAGLIVCDFLAHEGYKEADVYFLGYQANAFKFYQHSRLFVLSSAWEGFPNAMAEALFCNLPVVAADCPTGPREILNSNGILSQQPIAQPIRGKVGSLMPLLKPEDSLIATHWKNELQYWVTQPGVEGKDFEALTARFPAESILAEWQELIEKTS